MEFRRIPGLPPYVFTIIDGLKESARAQGRDVVDLGFGNPDIPSPEVAVQEIAAQAANTRNHRYSSSRGIPDLRAEVAQLYRRRFEVELDPETEILSTIGAKEGFSHLMWVLLQPGDVALVPSPSYPIHIWGPYFAGADAREISLGDRQNAADYIDAVIESYEYGWPKPRVVVLSFPHNPTCTIAEKADLQRIVDWAQDKDVVLVHDFAYAETGFDGWLPPSILECDGAKNVAVELYSMTKSFSMAGWRVAFMVGNADVVAALAKMKSYLDYGTFQPIQLAAAKAMHTVPEYTVEVNEIYESRRNALCKELSAIGWDFPKPRGTMFAWAKIPEPYRHMGSIEFAKMLVNDCNVAVSPGVGFGADGDEYVRFALIETEERIAQAARQLKAGLTKLNPER